jgi:TRAP-type C4-dicarboxylate transport system permease small subunit
MKEAYVRAMDALYLACVAVAGLCITIMTIVVPIGVFYRYVLNSALAWPEPMATIMMIFFTFLGGAACYRAGVHISVTLFVGALGPAAAKFVEYIVEIAVGALCLFMLIWGSELVHTTMFQTVAEFPFLAVGLTYLPVPVGGAVTLLFMIERMWIGPPPATSFVHREPPSTN